MSIAVERHPEKPFVIVMVPEELVYENVPEELGHRRSEMDEDIDAARTDDDGRKCIVAFDCKNVRKFDRDGIGWIILDWHMRERKHNRPIVLFNVSAKLRKKIADMGVLLGLPGPSMIMILDDTKALWRNTKLLEDSLCGRVE